MVEISEDKVSVRPLVDPSRWPLRGEQNPEVDHIARAPVIQVHTHSAAAASQQPTSKMNPDVPEFVPGRGFGAAGGSGESLAF